MDDVKTNGRSNFGSKGWMLIILCLIGCFVSSSASGSINVGATHFMETFECTQTQLMLGATIGQIIGAIIAFFGGKILVYFSPRRLILICGIVYCVFFILNGRSTSLAQFLITFIIFMSAAWFWCFMCSSALIANWFPRKRGLAMGWVTIGMPLGSGVAAMLMSAIAGKVGFYASYYPYAILALVVVILYNVFLTDFPAECGCYPDNDKTLDMEQLKNEENELRELQKRSPWTLQRIFSSKEFWFICLSAGFMAFASGFMAQVIPTMLSFGIDASVAPMFMMGVCVCSGVGSYLMGIVDTKIGSKKAMTITFILLIFMGIIEQVNSLPAKLVCFAILGVTLGANSNFLLSIVMHTWGKVNCMGVFRYAQPIVTFISALGPTVVAAIATACGGNYDISFMFMSMLSVVGMILILLVKEGAVKKKEESFQA